MADYALLTEDNPKTRKGEELGYYSVILHLMPSDFSGHRVCVDDEHCKHTCLGFSGRGPMPQTVAARLRRTNLFFDNRKWFMAMLVNDIYLAAMTATERDMDLVVRLNGTSDIPWEKMRTLTHRNVMELFPDVQFMDYTKVFGRKVPSNYHLTFSLSETNQANALRWLEQGGNVAAIYDKDMPAEMLGYSTIDGDEHDLRFLDPTPRIVALKRKVTRIPMQFKLAA